MIRTGAAIALLAAGSLAATVQPVAAQSPTTTTVSRGADPDAIGVSLKAIRKQLQAAPPTPTARLRLNFHVEVVGTEPRVDFFKEFDLRPTGGLPYGAPSHWELINAATPLPWRTYGGMDLLSWKRK